MTAEKKPYAKPRTKSIDVRINWARETDPAAAAKLKAALIDWLIKGIKLPGEKP